MADLTCVECLGPATIQFVDAHGNPLGTLCAECDAAYQRMWAKVKAMLADATRNL